MKFVAFEVLEELGLERNGDKVNHWQHDYIRYQTDLAPRVSYPRAVSLC